MYKQVIIIRKDLKWGKGKLAAHAAHASVGALMMMEDAVAKKWMAEGAKKVVLKVKDIADFQKVKGKIKDSKIPHFLVRDAGLTQLKAGTVTALGIGPVEEKKIDKITGKLKLL